MNVEEFINELETGNEALFVASEMQAEAFFGSGPSNEDLVRHFTGRCTNEYLNMIEVAQRLLEYAPTGDRKMVKHLAKQIFDEAHHYDLVADIIERLTGEPLDIQALLNRDAEDDEAKGARCLQELEEADPLALHTYQFIAEGRAHRVWRKMAEVCDDEHVRQTYAKISRDEKYHREIGREGLMKSIRTEQDMERVRQIADAMRYDLYEVSCGNCVEVPEARAIVSKAYGDRYLN